MIEVKVPDIGDFADVPVIEVLVEPGQEVEAEQPLVTLESDKATMEIPAPQAGVVHELLVALGDRVSAGAPILLLEADGGDSDAASEEAEPQDEAAPATTPPSTDHVADTAPEADRHVALVVIGGGPGGYTAAFRAADLGLDVLLVERHERLGGVCLNVGCIPSKALLHIARVIAEASDTAAHGVSFGKPNIDLDALRRWKEDVIDKLTGGLASLAKQRKVEVLHGHATFSGSHTIDLAGESISFDHCIIATGSSAVSLPSLPEDPRILDSTSALALTTIPKRLLVVGGGIIGLELATVYQALGSKVTVVELTDQLIPGADADMVRPLHKRISDSYEAVHLSVGLSEVKPTKTGLRASFEGGPKPATFDAILVAVGRRPNGSSLSAEHAGVAVDDRGFVTVDQHMRTNVAHIYAIGDVVGEPMLAHKATHEAKVAAEVIAGHDVVFDPVAIPSVAYTDPEIAWAGLTETAAKAQGIECEVSTFPWAASGRALSLARPDGATKLLSERGTQRLLGVGIVGIGAGDLIAEGVLALEMGADAEDVGLTIHPHPTLSETVGFAAEAATGTITDLIPKRKRP